MKSYILQIFILLIICSCKRSESSKIEDNAKDKFQIDHKDKDSLELNVKKNDNQEQIIQRIESVDSIYASHLEMLPPRCAKSPDFEQ